jgi:competence transcription factor ComK
LLPHKLIEIIFRRFFPAKQPEVTEKDNLIEVMAQYFLLVNEIPYDNFSIQFYEDKWVHIQITYDSAEDAYEHIDALKEYQLEKDMSDMFPYMFVVESCVS